MKLSEILLVEDDPAILTYRCPRTGLPLWPLLRNYFVRFLISELSYSTPSTVPPVRSPWERRRAALNLPLCIGRNLHGQLRGLLRRPIMVFASGQGLLDWRGQTINRLSDHLALARPEQTVVWEGSVHQDRGMPLRRLNGDIVYTLPFDTTKSLLPRLWLGTAQARLADSLVEFVCGRARRLFDLDVPSQVRAQMVRHVAIAAYQGVMIGRHYGSFFRRYQPRLILMESGCYGQSAPLICTARKLRIPVTEYQHGMVGSGHHAYNFAPAMLESAEFRDTLPDYFLSYGSWWSQRINAPVRKIAIGNPHRSEQIDSVAGCAARQSRQALLIIAKPGDAPRFIELGLALTKRLDQSWRIVVRPHPRDGKTVQLQARVGSGAVRIDTNEDLYVSLGEAQAVAGGPSTALMEAVGVVDRIFMWNMPGADFLFPEHPFETFEGADDLSTKMRTPHTAQVREEDVWAANWRTNYIAFTDQFLR